jgi:hypothetical protein
VFLVAKLLILSLSKQREDANGANGNVKYLLASSSHNPLCKRQATASSSPIEKTQTLILGSSCCSKRYIQKTKAQRVLITYYVPSVVVAEEEEDALEENPLSHGIAPTRLVPPPNCFSCKTVPCLCCCCMLRLHPSPCP